MPTYLYAHGAKWLSERNLFTSLSIPPFLYTTTITAEDLVRSGRKKVPFYYAILLDEFSRSFPEWMNPVRVRPSVQLLQAGQRTVSSLKKKIPK